MNVLKDRRGSLSIIFLGLVFTLLLLTFLVMEVGGSFAQSDHAESILQRACNSAVEKNMADAYRADHVRQLNVSAAIADFRRFAQADLPDKYRLSILSVTGTASPPSLTARGTVTFQTLFGQFGHNSVTIRFEVTSTNYTLT